MQCCPRVVVTGRKIKPHSITVNKLLFIVFFWKCFCNYGKSDECVCVCVCVCPDERKGGQRGGEGLQAVHQPVSLQRLVQRLPGDPAHQHPARGASQDDPAGVMHNYFPVVPSLTS